MKIIFKELSLSFSLYIKYEYMNISLKYAAYEYMSIKHYELLNIINQNSQYCHVVIG